MMSGLEALEEIKEPILKAVTKPMNEKGEFELL